MNKKVIAVAVAASIAIMAIWYVAIYSPQSHSIHKARTAAAASKVEATTLRANIALLEQEKTQLPAAQAKLSTLTLALPNTPALDKLIDDINNAATLTGVDWKNITPTKPATFNPGEAAGAAVSGNMQSVNVTLGVAGNYHQVTAFISQLTGLSRLLTVDSVNLSGVGGDVSSVAQIATQIFFVPPTATAPTTTVAP